jgi:hypothetical protein
VRELPLALNRALRRLRSDFTHAETRLYLGMDRNAESRIPPQSFQRTAAGSFWQPFSRIAALAAVLLCASSALAEGPASPILPSPGGDARPQVRPADPPNLNWAGLGVRFGIAWWTLSSRGLPVEDSADLNVTLKVLTPTLHLGGDRRFVKIDFVIGAGDELKLYGLGFYPLSYGYFIAPIRLFPYGALGGTLNYATQSADRTNPSRMGLLVQSRVALGAKWRPIPSICGSIEVGYSPWAAGALGSAPSTTTGSQAISLVGGTGRVWDVSVGIELL